uniref:ATP synthase F0 subunit 8 n=1 Tax=Bothriometopus macrocnemis TaxID=475769 RepID=A8VU00_9NEOP|nr:ATP synthase F0 subunit 8 [Bothriometopus macrocnemis]ABW20538.1 ATP synthase F0 subunit 8 [Bothriometopus macrocnemis]UTT72561.1 ATP synthase F0 subunit 8 [Bothriometopus macrocnemis]
MPQFLPISFTLLMFFMSIIIMIIVVQNFFTPVFSESDSVGSAAYMMEIMDSQFVYYE